MKVVVCVFLPLLTAGVRKGEIQSEAKVASLVSAKSSSYAVLRDLQGQEATPGVAAALGKVKTDMEGVISKIGEDHKETVAGIQSLVQMLSESTDAAVEKYKGAKQANSKYNECVGWEHRFLRESEAAFEQLQEAKKDRVAPCALQESLKDFTSDFNEPSFECTISDTNHCDSQLTTWNQDFGNGLGDIEVALEARLKKYDAAKTQCDSADTAISNHNSEYQNKLALHQTTHSKCLQLKTERDTGMCSSFGFGLQKKCMDHYRYLRRVAAIKGEGTSWSKKERVEEFTAAKVTMCLIGGFLSNVKVDSSLLSSCSAQADYDKYFGPTDYKEEAVKDLMTAAKFNCHEEAIPFDRTWKVPAKIEGARSKDYVNVRNWIPSYSPTGDQPFEQC